MTQYLRAWPTRRYPMKNPDRSKYPAPVTQDEDLLKSETARRLEQSDFSAGRRLQGELRKKLKVQAENQLTRRASRQRVQAYLRSGVQWIGAVVVLITLVVGLNLVFKNILQVLPAHPATLTPLAETHPVDKEASPAPADSTPELPTQLPYDVETTNLPVWQPSLQIGKGVVTSLAISPDGRWMAVGTPQGVYQYRAGSFEQAWFTPLPQKVVALSFTPNSQRTGVMSGGSIYLLESETGQQQGLIETNGSSFAWSPDGNRLVSMGACETVIVWDAATGAVLKELRGERCSEGYSGISVTWAADGRIYAASMGTRLMAWDDQTYEPVSGLTVEGAPETWVSALLAAPEGSLLAQYDSMGSPVIAIIDGQYNQQIVLLDQGVNGPIVDLAWAPDGKRLAVVYGMGTSLTLIWNAETGQVEYKIEGFYPSAGLAWMPDGQTLAGMQSMDGLLHAVDIATGRSLRSISGHTLLGSLMTWSQDGLVTSNGVDLTWWDPHSGQPLRKETAGSPDAWVLSWPASGPGIFLFGASQGPHRVGTVGAQATLVEDGNNYPFPTAWLPDGNRLAGPTRVW
ncbi:MAG: hypothetical protein EHM70_23075, partial [Chloroflexota bacterium]